MATTASTAPLSWSSKVKTEDSRFNPCAPIWNSAWILQEKPRTGFYFFLRLGKSLVPLLPFGLLGALRWTDILLRRAAEEMKQIQRAAKAAKLAQGLTAIRKRKRRTQGKRKTSQRPLAASAAQDISDVEWASDSDSLTEDAEGADGSPSMPASLGKGSASAPPGPAVRRQTVPSHPMGTLPNSSNHPCFRSDRLGSYICGQYCDRGNTLSCKKAVSRGSTLTDAVCILRLKRRLIAGCSDADWPIHRQRSHHVGKGLQDFAEGMSEAEMDALVESWR